MTLEEVLGEEEYEYEEEDIEGQDDVEGDEEPSTAELLQFLWAHLQKKNNWRGMNAQDDLDQYCISPDFDWMHSPPPYFYNPCRLSRTLIDECSSTAYYPLPRLLTDNQTTSGNFGDYIYPIVKGNQVSDCICNVDVYNLVMACASCQRKDADSFFAGRMPHFSDFTQNCYNRFSFFPRPLPVNQSGIAATVNIPEWAQIAYPDNGQFNLSDARGVAFKGSNQVSAVNFPSSTSATTLYLSSTDSTVSTSTAEYSSATTSGFGAAANDTTPPSAGMAQMPQHPHKHTGLKMAALVGIALAIIMFLLALMAFIFYLLRKRQQYRLRGTRLKSDPHLPISSDKFDEKDGAVTAYHRASTSNLSRTLTSTTTSNSIPSTAGTELTQTTNGRNFISRDYKDYLRGLVERRFRARGGVAPVERSEWTDSTRTSTLSGGSTATSEETEESVGPFGDQWGVGTSGSGGRQRSVTITLSSDIDEDLDDGVAVPIQQVDHFRSSAHYSSASSSTSSDDVSSLTSTSDPFADPKISSQTPFFASTNSSTSLPIPPAIPRPIPAALLGVRRIGEGKRESEATFDSSGAVSETGAVWGGDEDSSISGRSQRS